jgi:hypothetical protein
MRWGVDETARTMLCYIDETHVALFVATASANISVVRVFTPNSRNRTFVQSESITQTWPIGDIGLVENTLAQLRNATFPEGPLAVLLGNPDCAALSVKWLGGGASI